MTMYMQIDGIKGDVTISGYQGWIEIEGFDLGVGRNIKVRPGQIQNREGEVPNFQDVTIIKQIDKSTPHLFIQSCTGKAIPNIHIHACSTGETPKPYLKLTLNKSLISKYKRHAIKGVKPVEIIKLNFTKIEDTYIPYDSSQNAGSPIKSGYDLETMTKV